MIFDKYYPGNDPEQYSRGSKLSRVGQMGNANADGTATFKPQYI